ncbi:hypothetical protein GCM10010869_62400 [Mesorhizobium tianshanense]|nr:hypothetical protein GCM10010869_62400 [Mesorhizobium tianshanense]
MLDGSLAGAPHREGADRFNCWVDAENEFSHFLFAGIVSAGVQDPQVDLEMLPVVGP